MWEAYALFIVETNNVFYVGMTNCDSKRRFYQHLYESNANKNRYSLKEQILRKNKCWYMVLKKHRTKSAATISELNQIEHFKNIGCFMTNKVILNTGGYGTRCYQVGKYIECRRILKSKSLQDAN